MVFSLLILDLEIGVVVIVVVAGRRVLIGSEQFFSKDNNLKAEVAWIDFALIDSGGFDEVLLVHHPSLVANLFSYLGQQLPTVGMFTSVFSSSMTFGLRSGGIL